MAKEFGLVHSYTLECGYHSVTELKPIVNLKKSYAGTPWQFQQADECDIKSRVYVKGAPEFTIKIYENVGKQLLVSILDLFE